MARQKANTDQTKSTAGSRERLLEAATDIFGRHGYDAATTRMIAREAGVNIAAIPYYFNGKEGLYRAVVEHIVSLVAGQIADTRQDIAARPFTGPAAPEEAAHLLEQLLTKIITFMVGSPQAQRVARIILREQLYPSAAYDIIFTGFMASSLDTVATLLKVISGDPSERTARIRAMAVFGQVLAFRVARETVVRALGMEGYNQDETEEIRMVIIEHTRSILAALRCGEEAPAEKQP